MSTARPFPPGPFVTDDRYPGNVYCDDDVGTAVAICIPKPDLRLVRYDGVVVADRIAKCLTACEGIDDPAAALTEARRLLADLCAEETRTLTARLRGPYAHDGYCTALTLRVVALQDALALLGGAR